MQLIHKLMEALDSCIFKINKTKFYTIHLKEHHYAKKNNDFEEIDKIDEYFKENFICLAKMPFMQYHMMSMEINYNDILFNLKSE